MGNIRENHTNRVKVLSGKVKNLIRQDRIEKVAYDKFKFYVPAPESLIVYLGDKYYTIISYSPKPYTHNINIIVFYKYFNSFKDVFYSIFQIC